MKPLIKLLGAIAFLIASGSVLALERSPFAVFNVAEPADWMLLCGFVTLVSIGRRRRILTQMNLWHPISQTSDIVRMAQRPNTSDLTAQQ